MAGLRRQKLLLIFATGTDTKLPGFAKSNKNRMFRRFCGQDTYIDRADRPGRKVLSSTRSGTQVEERADKYLIPLQAVKGSFRIFGDFFPPGPLKPAAKQPP